MRHVLVHLYADIDYQILHRSIPLALADVAACTAGTIPYFIDTVFNYPSLAEAYKVAAFDGLHKL